MIDISFYDERSEQYLDVSLYSKRQPLVDISIFGEGPGVSKVELTKDQVSSLIVGLVEIHKEML